MADTPGSTKITYEATPQPVAWALSVPSGLSLETVSTVDKSCLQANATIAIVKEDGSDFIDNAKDRTFTVSGTFSSIENARYYFTNKKEPTQKVAGQYRIFDQGSTVSDWGASGGLYPSTVKDLMAGIPIKSFADNHMSPIN